MDFFGASQPTENPKKHTSVLWCVRMHGNNYSYLALSNKNTSSSAAHHFWHFRHHDQSYQPTNNNILDRSINTMISSTDQQCYRPVKTRGMRLAHAFPKHVQPPSGFLSPSVKLPIYFRKTIWIKILVSRSFWMVCLRKQSMQIQMICWFKSTTYRQPQ